MTRDPPAVEKERSVDDDRRTVSGGASLLAALTLPLLFAAGMSAFDPADGLLMSVAYSWSNRNPALLWRVGRFEERHPPVTPRA